MSAMLRPVSLDTRYGVNALPQTVTANVNCRIFPGTPSEDVRQTLTQVIGDPKVQSRVASLLGDPAKNMTAAELGQRTGHRYRLPKSSESGALPGGGSARSVAEWLQERDEVRSVAYAFRAARRAR